MAREKFTYIKHIHDNDVNCRLQLESLIRMYMGYMYNRTFRMFDYKNLPSGITIKDMEKYTQIEGKSFFLKIGDRFYILRGDFKWDVTWNNEPKSAIIVNPALGSKLKSTEYILDDDCICLPNDSMFIGLNPLHETNAVQLASTDISLTFASFNTRLKKLFTANDDNTKKSIDKLLDDIYNGKEITSIVTDDLYKSSIESVDYNTSSNNDIKDLIELKQYIKANWYIDLGINANYNMKREAINDNETHVNDDALIPLIDDMLICRQDAIKKINEKYGLDISVELSSAWKKIREEITLKLEAEKKSVESEEKSEEKIEGDSNEA